MENVGVGLVTKVLRWCIASFVGHFVFILDMVSVISN